MYLQAIYFVKIAIHSAVVQKQTLLFGSSHITTPATVF